MGYYKIEKKKDGEFQVELFSFNGKSIGHTERYPTKSIAMETAQDTIPRNVKEAVIIDETIPEEKRIKLKKGQPYFVISLYNMKNPKNKKWKIELKGANHEKILTPTQKYNSKSGARNGIESIQHNAQTKTIKH